jgi:hypothetical protein
MRLPRHAEVWGWSYACERWGRWTGPGRRLERVWLTLTDHFEPFWHNRDEKLAAERVELWRRGWPEIARRHEQRHGRRPQYCFFYPEEEYRPELLDALAELTHGGWGDVEVHLHHDNDTEGAFMERTGRFLETLERRHALLRRERGRLAFGFIHGNWCLDNSGSDGRWCGLNNEITLLRELGCYADFTMPSGDSPTQARRLNRIYWAVDDPERPKSYDDGVLVEVGRLGAGDLLMIPGPFGLRWGQGRVVPRLEAGELASQDLATPYRVKRWLELAPRVGGDLFLKLHTHGTQERNSAALLGGGLERLFELLEAECGRRGVELHYATAWQMRQAVERAAGG